MQFTNKALVQDGFHSWSATPTEWKPLPLDSRKGTPHKSSRITSLMPLIFSTRTVAYDVIRLRTGFRTLKLDEWRESTSVNHWPDT